MFKFIGGMIVGELNGIALGVAGTVVAICVFGIVDKEDRKTAKRYDFTKYQGPIGQQYYTKREDDQNE